MSLFNLLCLFTFYTCFAAKGPPTVEIPEKGVIIGREVSRSRVQKIIGYYGIPYAKPPLEKLRFAPPEPELPWNETLNATEFKPACLQTSSDIPEGAKPFLNLIFPAYENLTMSEDCLYLNVFVPSGNSPPDGFATVVWFHPGNFETGGPSMWNPHTLVYKHRIIVVTFAWRLGIMGFFTTMDGEAPGNYALLDQQFAIKWVKKYIKIFGGNPDNISLMGYGSGGVSVGLHMINSESRQFFSKAIIMSANLFSPSIVKYSEDKDKDFLDYIADEFACTKRPTSELMDCLRNPAIGDDLVRVTSHINWKPLVDYSNLSNHTLPFIHELPQESFKNNDFHQVPLLTGYTDMEDILNILASTEVDISNNFTLDNLQQFLTNITDGDIPKTNISECDRNNDIIIDSVKFFYGPSPSVKDPEELRRILVDTTNEKNYGASTYSQAVYLSSKSQPTFVYRFDMKPSTKWLFENIPDWVSVPHFHDLVYVWGMPYWQEFDGKNWETRDKSFSNIVMSLWTNFIKYSDPSKTLLYPIHWDQFTKDEPKLMIIDGPFNMSNNKSFNYKAFEFWNEYYPKVLKVGTQCCTAPDEANFSLQVSYVLLSSTLSLHFVLFTMKDD